MSREWAKLVERDMTLPSRDRMDVLEAALREIKDMKSEIVADGFVTGPAAMLAACKRVAREALRKPKTK